MRKFCLLFLYSALAIGLMFGASDLRAADKDGEQKRPQLRKTSDDPIVETDVAWHDIGTLWSRVTNYGKTGDDAYQDRTPSGDWPGGSGNSYLYRGSLWLSAKVDGVVHSTQPEDNEYSPITPITIIDSTDESGQVVARMTHAKYYDVQAPLATGHFPLGLEVTEKTYSWAEGFRDDFIIYEYIIKNVGVDTDGDGYPDEDRALDEFYFTYRLDGDVSKLPEWDAEYRFSNQDDHAAVNSSLGIFTLYSEWDSLNNIYQHITEDDMDSTLTFMWDGDNPEYPAFDGGPENDMFNPGVDGRMQTPGFLGYKILKTEPASFKPSAFHTNHIYNDPQTDQESYDRMMAPKEFESDGPSGVLVNPATGQPFPNDYRAVLSLGPLETLDPGDSVRVIAALGVGALPDSSGYFNLAELFNIMDVAQFIVDSDFELDVASAPAPQVEVKERYNDAGQTTGMEVIWDRSPENFVDDLGASSFYGYVVERSKVSGGQDVWTPLGAGEYVNAPGSDSWPPPVKPDDPTKCMLIDTDVQNGFVYKYRVYSITDNILFGVFPGGTSQGVNLQLVVPSAPVATNLDNVRVVPNPYIGSQRWNNPQPSDTEAWQHRLQFINLPEDATVKIFTLDLDYVDEVKAGQLAINSSSFDVQGKGSVAEWDLITRNDQEAAPGIYIYVVDSPSAGTKTGKFVIIR